MSTGSDTAGRCIACTQRLSQLLLMYPPAVPHAPRICGGLPIKRPNNAKRAAPHIRITGYLPVCSSLLLFIHRASIPVGIGRKRKSRQAWSRAWSRNKSVKCDQKINVCKYDLRARRNVYPPDKKFIRQIKYGSTVSIPLPLLLCSF